MATTLSVECCNKIYSALGVSAGNELINAIEGTAPSSTNVPLTSLDVGKAADGVYVLEEGDGIIHRTHLLVPSADFTTQLNGEDNTIDLGVGAKVYTWPKGVIAFLGGVVRGTLTAKNAKATWSGKVGLGTSSGQGFSVAGNAANLISATSVNGNTPTLSIGNFGYSESSQAFKFFVDFSSGVDLYLNGQIDAGQYSFDVTKVPELSFDACHLYLTWINLFPSQTTLQQNINWVNAIAGAGNLSFAGALGVWSGVKDTVNSVPAP